MLRHSRTAHGRQSLWLSGSPNPTKCSIITAYENKQVAGESFLDRSDFKQGVLTCCILEVLAQQNKALLGFPTRARIREYVHVRTLTPDGSASQTPSVPGDGDIEFFFGDKIRVERPANPQARSDFLDEIEKTANLSFPTDPTKPADFVVSINADGTFEVHERGVRLPRLPSISQRDPEAIEKIAYVVRHVARYRAIEGILNCSSTTHVMDDDFVFTLSQRRPKNGLPSVVNDRLVRDKAKTK